MKPATTKKQISEVLPLTSLRFFLASWIVLFHLDLVAKAVHGAATAVPTAGAGLAWFNIVHCAYVAVGIFFVLSGFILALNYPLDRPWTNVMRWKFAVARFSRIYPVYVLALVAVAPVVLGQAIEAHSRSLLLRRMSSGLLNLLMLQAWVPHGALTWNGPGWSLSSEAFFYLCFPVLGALVYRVATVRKEILLLAGLLATELLAPSICVLLHVKGFADMPATAVPDSFISDLVKFNPVLNLALFLSGVTACRLYQQLRVSRASLVGKGYLFYVPSFLLMFLITAYGDRIPYPLMHSGLILPSALGIVIGLALGDRYLCAIFSNRLLVFLGKASYAEYLLHFPVRLIFESRGIPWTYLQQAAYFLTVLAISAVVFHFYEEPMQRYLRKLLQPSKVQSATQEQIQAVHSEEPVRAALNA
jgi:peptidoglycan/LPS O-acetylase OafA/YrhL